MMLHAKSFAQELNRVLEQEGVDHNELAEKAGISRSTMWRYVQGELNGVSRRKAVQVARTLGYHLQMDGDTCHLVKNKTTERETNQKYELQSEIDNETIGGCLEMLKEMSYRKLKECEKVIGFVANLDDYELIELSRLVDILNEEQNKELLIEKLRALTTLVMPYQARRVKKEDES